MTADIESVLGLFAAQSAPQRMLRWHYRSRHESLIAVSNHAFYNDRLVIFPSPDAAREQTAFSTAISLTALTTAAEHEPTRSRLRQLRRR